MHNNLMDMEADRAASRAGRVRLVRSPGGVLAWLREDYAVPLLAMDFAFRGGCAQDPRDQAGLCAFLAGSLDEGAGPYDSSAFQAALEDHAVHLHYSAGRDWLTGHFQTLTRNQDAAFDLLSLSIRQARLDEEPLERVRGQLIASYKSEINDPDSLAARLFREAAFGDHPYAAPARGDADSLGRIRRADLLSQRDKLMARDNLIVAVVGAISEQELARRLDQVFADLPAHAQLQPIAPVKISGIGQTKVQRLDTPQSVIRFGREGLSSRDPDYMAGMIANHILGGGVFTARLFKEVREARGLAYSVYSQMQNLQCAALLAGATSTKNARALEALEVIKAQIADLGANGPSDEEIDKAKKYLIGSYALNFDTSRKIAGQLLFLQQEGLTPAYLDEREAMIAAASSQDIARACARMFGDGALLVTIAGQPEGL